MQRCFGNLAVRLIEAGSRARLPRLPPGCVADELLDSLEESWVRCEHRPQGALRHQTYHVDAVEQEFRVAGHVDKGINNRHFLVRERLSHLVHQRVAQTHRVVVVPLQLAVAEAWSGL